MNATKSASSNFLQKMARLAEALRASETGPLIVSAEVIAMASHWEEFRDEAGGLNACAACRKYLGHPLAWFERRYDAVELFGRDVRQWMSHSLAVWLLHKAVGNEGGEKWTPDLVKRVKEALLFAFSAKRKRHLPVGLEEAEKVVYAVIGKPVARENVCVECARKEAEIIELKRRLRKFE